MFTLIEIVENSVFQVSVSSSKQKLITLAKKIAESSGYSYTSGNTANWGNEGWDCQVLVYDVKNNVPVNI